MIRSVSASFSLLALLLCATRADGSCGAPEWNPTVFATDVRHYAGADLDGDGAAEIIGASATSLTIRRPASLTSPTTIYTGTALGNPVTGDFTSDGKTDIAIADGSSLIVLPGNGNATFGTPIATTLGWTPSQIAAGTFSASSGLDIAAIGSAATLYLLSGNGAGTFTELSQIGVGTTPARIAAANLDGDGFTDVAVSHADSTTVNVIYVNGDGTNLQAQVTSTANDPSIAAGDYDGDGDGDLIAFNSTAFKFFRNAGGRSLSHDGGFTSYDGVPGGIVSADFSGDGKQDVAVVGTLAHVSVVVVLSDVDGSLLGWSKPRLQPLDRSSRGASIAAGDFNGDGRLDFVVEKADRGLGELSLNTCGDAHLLWGGPQKISSGRQLPLQIAVYPPVGTTPLATGEIVLVEGGATLATGPLVPLFQYYGYASFVLQNLSDGIHNITARYGGDGNLAAAEKTFCVVVTTETTTITLTSDPPTTTVVWGQPLVYTATVTSSTGETPVGPLGSMSIRATNSITHSGKAPQMTSVRTGTNVGIKTITAIYAGSETLPPTSVEASLTVNKAQGQIVLQGQTSYSRPGTTARFNGTVTTQHGTLAPGWVYFEEGNGSHGFVELDPPSAPGFNFTATNMAPGAHALTLRYIGNSNVNDATLHFTHTVVPGTTTVLFATAGPQSVRLDFLTQGEVGRLYRRTTGSNWTLLTQTGGGFFVDTAVTAGTVYQYRVESYTSNVLVDISNIETVWVGAFTDAQLTGAAVKAQHFIELQTAVNAVRATASLPPLTTSFGGIIQAAHLSVLRAGLNELRSATGLPPITFTDSVVAGATVIRAVHLNELRAAIQ